MKGPKYSNLEELLVTEGSRILKATHSQTGDLVLIKESLLHDSGRIHNEARLLGRLEPELDFQLSIHNGHPALIRPYIPGQSLRRLLESKRSVKQSLSLALKMLDELERVHKQEIIHKDINPSNFIYNEHTDTVHLIDYELGTPLITDLPDISPLQQIEGTLEYISPEQSGRMNRRIDYRSDFYSFGITLYEMLVGSLPFESSDPLEIIHCHLAQKPKPAHKKDERLPEHLSSVIDKLLSKNAEDRYQSINGIRKDLQLCLDSLESTKGFSNFKPGLSEELFRLNLSQRLYGRSDEQNVLKDAYEWASSGNAAVLQVYGPGGIGKSRLIQELYKPVTKNRGLFFTGVFDSVSSGIPFYPWRKILESFTNWVLSESSDSKERWTSALSGLMAEVGHLLADICPEIKLLSREKLAESELDSPNRRQLLNYAFNELFRIISENCESYVIFLDDWQWSDQGSCNVLSSVLENANLKGILLVISYRDEEIPLGHSFEDVLKAIPNSPNFKNYELGVPPISDKSIIEMVRDTLGEGQNNVEELAELVVREAKGNPFSALNLLKNLHSSGSIYFNFDIQSWDWKINEIKKEILKRDLSEFDAEHTLTQFSDGGKAIKAASIIGAQFRLFVLAELLKANQEDVHEALGPAIESGWISAEDANYRFIPGFYSKNKKDILFRFTHARIRLAYYKLWSNEEKESFHFSAANILIENGKNAKLVDDDVFRIAHHLSNSALEIRHDEKAIDYANILADAGKRSFNLAAFDNAITFLEKSKQLRPEILKSSSEAGQLSAYYIQSSFYTGSKERAAESKDEALNHFRDPESRSLVQSAWISCLIADADMPSAVEYARNALKEYNVKLPKKANTLQVILGSIKTGKTLPKKMINEISDLSLMTDANSLAAMHIMDVSLAPYFLTNIATYPLLLFYMVRISMKQGVSPESVLGFGSYGLVVAGILKKPVEGYQIGTQALLLLDRLKAEKQRATAYFTHCLFIGHHEESLSAQVHYCDEGYASGLRSGNLEYAGWNIFAKMALAIPLGMDCQALLKEGEKLYDFQRQNSLENQKAKTLCVLEYLWNMLDEDLEKSWNRNSPELDRELQKAVEAKDISSLFTFHSYKGIFLMLNLEFERAFSEFEIAEKHIKSVVGTFNVGVHYIFMILCACKIIDEKKSTRKLTKAIRKSFSKCEKIYKRNPFLQRTFLRYAELEMNRVKGLGLDASDYEELIHNSMEENMPLIASMASVSLAEFLKDINEDKAHLWYNHGYEVAKSVNLLRWAKQIQNNSETMNIGRTSVTKNKTLKTFGSSINQIDLDAISLVKAATAISAEIKLEGLIEKLLDVAIENAGARRAVFVLHRNGVNTIKMQTELKEGGKQAKQIDLNLDAYNEIPKSVISFCASTSSELVLSSAIEDATFNKDEYIVDKSIQSIMCVPIIHQNKISAFIYLENRIASGIFNQSRTDMIKLLAGQIAVSLENAFVYQNLETLVKERTEQLAHEKKRSDELLLNILPEQVADELKDSGTSKARKYDEVSVFFSDIVGFTSYAERVEPEELVREIDHCFRAYDDILSKYNIEKIKTIGDAYFCVAGVPSPSTNTANEILKFAVEVREWMAKEKEKRNGNFFDIRIGIHSGPVVAGVVGKSKFAYDVWGDTVNIGSRMEELSTSGEINVSEATYQLVKDNFDFEYRGEIEAKNKGLLKMYYLR